MPKKLKFIDWFAGIGGFRKGMENMGHECVGFCEFDRFAVASYTSMHLLTDEQRNYLMGLPLKQRQKEILNEEYRNGEWYAPDIRRVSADDIPAADCWCFGFPCQDISVAGKQVGFYGNRSSLFFRVMYLLGQVAEEKKPNVLFIENVKNLISVNGGWDFARLLVEMDKGGYDAEWQVLNSKYFGVPQNRERCFIIGHLRGRRRSEVFPVEGTNGADSVRGIRQIGGVKSENRNNPQPYRTYDPNGLGPCLNTMGGGGREPHIIKVAKYPSGNQKSDIFSVGGVSRTLAATDYKQPVSIGVSFSSTTSDKDPENKDEKSVAVCIDDFYKDRPAREYEQEAPTLRSDRLGLKVAVGLIDDQGRSQKQCEIKQTAPTLRSESHGNQPKVILEVQDEDKS